VVVALLTPVIEIEQEKRIWFPGRNQFKRKVQFRKFGEDTMFFKFYYGIVSGAISREFSKEVEVGITCCSLHTGFNRI